MLLDDGISIPLVYLLSYWYSSQEMSVKWNYVSSGCFTIGNGIRQGGVLSPYLFSRYIRGLLQNIVNSDTRCYIGDMCVNILAYPDDIVLLCPLWKGMQSMIDKLLLCAESINMSCNVTKTM